MLASGEIRVALDPDQVREAARRLVEMGAEALAIVFVNAYANPANEIAAMEAARDVWPNEHIERSSAILPEIREFESSISRLRRNRRVCRGQRTEQASS